jgi:hypothetical protein
LQKFVSRLDEEKLEDAFDDDLSEDTFAISWSDRFSGRLSSERRIGVGIGRRRKRSRSDESVRGWYLACWRIFA